ncbi:MAG: TetR/AcrR family transcriptional regulator [Caulobacteraceae bacterium]|nr:TetR/AcrR family transcriptional regulator [Caulobacteraceae bacterium]
MRYDAEHKRKTRERVLHEAGKAIRREGPHQIGVAGVMAQAGLTHGGFYAHFKSKDDMVVAAIAQMFAEGLERLAEDVRAHPPAEALSRYFDFYLSQRHRDTRIAGCPLPFLAADAPRLPPAAREAFAAGVEALRTALAEPIARLGRPDPEGEAASVLSELAGALALARAEAGLERSDAFLRRSRLALQHRLGLDPALIGRLDA